MPVLKAGACPALTENVLKALKGAGIHDVVTFIEQDVEHLVKITGVSYKDLLAIHRVLLAEYSAFPVNGDDLYEDAINSVAILPTGCESLNLILDGGLYTAEVTEVVGPPASGKSQFCLNTSIQVSMETEQNVFYLDTGGGLCTQRLHEILAEARKLSDQQIGKVCSRIRTTKAYDVFELLQTLEDLKQELTQQTDPFYCKLKLVVVDCITSVISPVLGGQQTDGLAYLTHAARSLKTLANEFSLAVLVVNNVVQSHAQGTQPALGRSWRHIPNTRFEFQRIDSSNSYMDCSSMMRKVVLTKSTRLPVPTQATFMITDKGLDDTTFHT